MAQGHCTSHKVSHSVSLTAGQENLRMFSLSMSPEPQNRPPKLLSSPGWGLRSREGNIMYKGTEGRGRQSF